MAGIYVHIPFCKSKCAYCDFYSTPRHELLDAYIEALIAEAKLRCAELSAPPTTLYLGGGTPSILAGDRLGTLVAGLADTFDLSALEEFTIEANPDDINADFLHQLHSLGINRVSIGIQTFEDATLALLNRRHNSRQAIEALTALKEDGINFSADLIFGLPNQSIDNWMMQLNQLLQFCPPHFSAYLLSYEPGTRLTAMLSKGRVEEASTPLVEQMYAALIAEAATAGYEHYEISNYCLPGAHSRHNSSYWTGEPYLGLGAAAHSFTLGARRYNPTSVKTFVDALSQGRTCYETEDETPDNRFNDLIITALRTKHGISLSTVAELFSTEIANELSAAAKPLINSGMLVYDEQTATLTILEERWLTSDFVMRELLRV